MFDPLFFLGKKLGYIVLSDPRSNPPNRFWGRGSISTISLAITASLLLTASSSTNLNRSRTTNPSGRKTQEEILVVDVGRQPDCNIVLIHPSISRFQRFVIRQAGIVEGLGSRGHSTSGIEIERGRGRQCERRKGRQRERESGKGSSRDRSLRVSQLGGHADGDRDRDRRGRQRQSDR
ncbi:hypothetical protein ACFX2J_044666 [Malus domestica]|uniref:Uncharacterized protein n=1 Tax=Malus domestica TaxID=3750 RepID=A0A498J6E6_MALDO|nr:hypothetical protein DVH24_031720 [Malus domestica]